MKSQKKRWRLTVRLSSDDGPGMAVQERPIGAALWETKCLHLMT